MNKVGSERHRRLCEAALADAGFKVFGAAPREAAPALPERHLGLVQAGETSGLNQILDKMAERAETHLDVDALLAAARVGARVAHGPIAGVRPPGQRIAVAQDDAFSFFYPHLALSWRRAGAELRFFSPLADETPPPECDVCWLPGGYPELHAGRIAGADAFLSGLRRFAETRPVHGECGGYMTLGRTLTDASGQVHAMAGLLNLESSFLQRKLHLGYRRARLLGDHCLGPAGHEIYGHEFHYTSITEERGEAFAKFRDAYDDTERSCGLRDKNVSGSFFHAIA